MKSFQKCTENAGILKMNTGFQRISESMYTFEKTSFDNRGNGFVPRRRNDNEVSTMKEKDHSRGTKMLGHGTQVRKRP